METRYTVRQATDATGVKSYVLRYWEDELGLNIHRNELGHRYYTGYDIQLFLNIKELKKKGLQLRAIRDMIPQMELSVPDSLQEERERAEGETAGNEEAPGESGNLPSAGKGEEPPEKEGQDREPQNEKILEFQAILERLIAQELQSKNEDEERCRSLDLAIRRQQIARREAAAANEKKNHKRRRGEVSL